MRVFYDDNGEVRGTWTECEFVNENNRVCIHREISKFAKSVGYSIIKQYRAGALLTYAAAKDHETGKVVALTIFAYTNRIKNHPNRVRKIRISIAPECSSPRHWDCPREIMELLSPTDDPASLEWRAEVNRMQELVDAGGTCFFPRTLLPKEQRTQKAEAETTEE